jgi:hemolysin activation/secretion protein
MSARGSVKPSPDTFGAADLIIDVTNKVSDASFTSDNRGNNYLGPFEQQFSVSENSALGLDERTSIRGLNTIPTSDLHYFSIENEEQIDSDGSKLLMQYSKILTRPHGNISYLGLEGTMDEYTATLNHPFLRSLDSNFSGRLVFDAKDTESDSLGIRQYDDRSRAIRLGGNYNTHDNLKGSDLLDAVISQGVSWPKANSGIGTSRIDGEEDFTKLNIDVSRIQQLPARFSLLTAFSGQYSARPLSLSEQFQLGGVGFGQAYDAGEVSGDSGLAGKIELRYDQPVEKPWLSSYQLYGYYDAGSVRLNDMGPGADNMLSLASAGGGIRSYFTSWLYGYAEVGFPLTRDVASDSGRDPRLFFSITAHY